MITKMTGTLNRVLDEEIRLQIGAFEYQVMVPECVRRQVQTLTGKELTLHVMEYLEASQMSNRFIPRRIGFLNEAEMEFFELFCTVDKISYRKAMKALGRPIREIADAIQRQDTKWLTTLPGIGKQSSEQIVATLRTKVTRFAMLPTRLAAPGSTENETGETQPIVVDAQLMEDVYQALMSVGHSPIEARVKLDQLILSGATFTNIEEALKLIYGKN